MNDLNEVPSQDELDRLKQGVNVKKQKDSKLSNKILYLDLVNNNILLQSNKNSSDSNSCWHIYRFHILM